VLRCCIGPAPINKSYFHLSGSNFSVALTHSNSGNSSPSSPVLHLLNVHVHDPTDFLAFARPEYVLDLAENRPAGTLVGTAELRGGGGIASPLELKIFPAKVRLRWSRKFIPTINELSKL